ncbi:MAG: hypothetical protein ABI382_05955 [Nakamurella sp.]
MPAPVAAWKVSAQDTARLQAHDPKDLTFRLLPAGVTEAKDLATAFNLQNPLVADAVRQITVHGNSVATTSGSLSDTAVRLGVAAAEASRGSDSASATAADAVREAADAQRIVEQLRASSSLIEDVTKTISQRVLAIQRDTDATADALQRIAEVIERSNETQTTIAAAVEEQTATTAGIARSVNDAATGSDTIAKNIEVVATRAQAVRTGGFRRHRTRSRRIALYVDRSQRTTGAARLVPGVRVGLALRMNAAPHKAISGRTKQYREVTPRRTVPRRSERFIGSSTGADPQMQNRRL